MSTGERALIAHAARESGMRKRTIIGACGVFTLSSPRQAASGRSTVGSGTRYAHALIAPSTNRKQRTTPSTPLSSSAPASSAIFSGRKS